MCLCCTCPCAAGLFIICCCRSHQTVARDPQSSQSERQASNLRANHLLQCCPFKLRRSIRQLMEIQETAGEAESTVSLEEAAEWFQNLNDLVSEPAGIQKRSQEMKRATVWSRRVLKVACSFSRGCQLKLRDSLCSATSAPCARVLQMNGSGGES